MNPFKRTLVGTKGRKSFILKVDDIVLFFLNDNVVFAVDKNNEHYKCEGNLLVIKSLLDRRFFRANRNYIVNVDYLLAFEPLQKVKLHLEMKLPEKNHDIIMSQETAKEFRKWISKL